MIDSLAWDPEMESPATIAILGAGPLGVEAALYARFLGYHVSIFETRRVAHRMLDWNLRPLEEPADKITTSLGLSALQAQDPTYIPPEPSRIFNGKQYAEEYLLPLAKTDLLFDDIHFLSPVIDISRFRVASQPTAGRFDEYPWQERCNDEFRILVEGRHRGTWVSRADCIIDCRGNRSTRVGLGPAGGLAIGELEARKEFLEHLPGDRKFDAKKYDAKSILIAGSTQDACRTLRECLEYAGHERLVWVLPPVQSDEPEFLAKARMELAQRASPSFVMIDSLGVESITPQEQGSWQVRLLKEDDSSVELQVDRIVSRTEYQETPLGPTLLAYNPQASNFLESSLQQYDLSDHSQDKHLPRARDVLTPEPGYFRLRADSLCEIGLERLRTIFAILGGRSDLDLYEIMRKQQSTGPQDA